MPAKVSFAKRSAQVAMRRRSVQCRCAPDVQRPSLESKVLDPGPFNVTSSFAETDAVLTSQAKHADEWLGSSPILSVPSTTGTTLAELEVATPLLPKTAEEAVEKEPEGLGAYLMQTAPVRCGFSLLQGFLYEWTTVKHEPSLLNTGLTCTSSRQILSQPSVGHLSLASS